MSTIAINGLNILGYQLFYDSESFLDELNHQETLYLEGGFYSTISGFGYGFNSKFGSHNGYYGYGSYGSSGSYSGSFSGYGGYGFGHKSYY